MNIALWVTSALLASMMLGAGLLKLFKTKEQLVANPHMAWAAGFSSGFIKFIGAVEVLGAIGLILPAVTGIAPVLVGVAAAGIGLVMVGAAITHVRLKEYSAIPINLALLALATVVAWGRLGPHRF